MVGGGFEFLPISGGFSILGASPGAIATQPMLRAESKRLATRKRPGLSAADVVLGRVDWRKAMNLFSSGGADVGGGGGGLGGDWASAIGGLGSAVAGIFATKQQTKLVNAMRKLQGGATRTMLPALATGFSGGVPAVGAPSGVGSLAGLAAAFGLGSLIPGGITDVLPGGLEEAGTGIFGPDLFRPTAASARQRMIDAVHPTTGERVYWRPVGRPILFAGDRALLLRTRKVLRRMNGPAGCGPVRRSVRRRRR